MLSLRVLDRIRDVPREQWDGLLRDDSSPFVEHTWLDCLEESGCVGEKSGWIPRHLALYDGSELIAAAPTYAKTHGMGEFVFDWNWADVAARMEIDYYPKLVVAVPFTPATGDRALCHPKRDRGELTAILAKGVSALVEELGLSSAHVLFPSAEEARAWSDAGFATRYGVQYHWSNGSPPFRTFEDFLATLPQKKRTQIRRERKQPAMDGVTIETLRSDEYTREAAHAMFDLYVTTVDKYFYGRRYLKRRFFELVAERFADRLAWVVAKKDDRIVGGAFNVAKNGVVYGRYWGAHVEMPFLHFNVCYYHGIDRAIQQGARTFNPGAGGEHKRVRGFMPTITYSAHYVANRRLRDMIESFLAREREAIAEHVAQERSLT